MINENKNKKLSTRSTYYQKRRRKLGKIWQETKRAHLKTITDTINTCIQQYKNKQQPDYPVIVDTDEQYYVKLSLDDLKKLMRLKSKPAVIQRLRRYMKDNFIKKITLNTRKKRSAYNDYAYTIQYSGRETSRELYPRRNYQISDIINNFTQAIYRQQEWTRKKNEIKAGVQRNYNCRLAKRVGTIVKKLFNGDAQKCQSFLNYLVLHSSRGTKRLINSSKCLSIFVFKRFARIYKRYYHLCRDNIVWRLSQFFQWRKGEMAKKKKETDNRTEEEKRKTREEIEKWKKMCQQAENDYKKQLEETRNKALLQGQEYDRKLESLRQRGMQYNIAELKRVFASQTTRICLWGSGRLDYLKPAGITVKDLLD